MEPERSNIEFGKEAESRPKMDKAFLLVKEISGIS